MLCFVISGLPVFLFVFFAHWQVIKGELVVAIGSSGADIGQFQDPRGLTLTPDETRLLVCDTNNHRVVVADARDGRSLWELRGPAAQPGSFFDPIQAVVVPQTGQVLVADCTRCLVVVFAGVDDDMVVLTIGDGRGPGSRQLHYPNGIAVLDGDVADAAAPDGPVAVVADTFNDRLVLFRVRDGTLMRHLGSRGDAPGQFHRPSAVTVVPARATANDEAWLLVVDEKNCRVQVLTRTGSVVRILQGDAGVRLSSNLNGVTVRMATGEVLVTDGDNRRVVSWCIADGGGFRVVCGMDLEDYDSDLESDGKLFVTPDRNDAGVDSLGLSTWNGLFPHVYAREHTVLLNNPWGVASGDGALWVVDSEIHRPRLCLFR
jgi:DNA-binding beta-propeller fold protein YncE